MSVDYYSCERCGDTFPDCGYYTTCSEDKGGCGRTWCSDECADEDGHIPQYCKLDKEIEDGYCDSEECEFAKKDDYGLSCEECSNYVEESCSYCRNEAFEDGELLEYALQGLKMSKQELIECLKEDKNGGN
jgi:hypothetical protein